MKKSKLSLGLVTSFIGALALSSCGATPAVTSSDDSIVDFIGYNKEDEKISINVDQFYSEYGDSDESTTLFYNAVLEALIRYEYPTLSNPEKRPGTTLKSFDTLQADAKEKLDAQIRVAQDNASSNGTTYAEEMDKILESNDCETEDDLKQKYLYELEKSEITDWYYNSNKDQLMDEYIGLNNEWAPIAESEEHDSVFPYHILHVLVKLGADASDYSRATITSAEAEKLWNVVRKLMDKSYSFEDVAFKESEDSSNTAYGDVGIMSTQTSFYNEFKLGVYAYDAILSGVNTKDNHASNPAIFKAFGVDDDSKVTTQVINASGVASETKEKVVDLVKEEMVEEVRNAVTGYGETPANQYTAIPTIPYDVFRKMYQWKDSEKIGDSIEPEAGATAYPRNVLFNQFLNFRSPFVITNEDISLEGSEQEQVTLKEHDFTSGDFRLANNNFKSGLVKNLGNTDKGNERKVLTDGNDNVIICVRSTAGIHFMVMRKSVFEKTNELVGKASVTLQDYYTTELPGSEDYPSETYVNMADYPSNPSYYTDRINTIKSKLKGTDSSDVFDAAYDYRIYEMLLSQKLDDTSDKTVEDNLVFFDEDEENPSVIKENIKEKIRLLRLSKVLSNDESINSAWQTYLAQLRHQNDIRNYRGMLPTTCAFSFSNKANANMYNKDRSEGGICNVK